MAFEKTSLSDDIKATAKSIKKHLAKKMRGKHDKPDRNDPNDSDRLRKFTRINPETGRPLFEMPIGTYKRRGDRYIKED